MHRCCCLGENFNCTSLPPYFNTLDKVATRPRSYIKIIKNIFNSFVLIDYGIHCLDYTEEEVRDLLVKKAFQEEAQVMEKYNRAKVTQVQLYTYFTGVTEIESLLAKYKEEQGENYQLKNFHEQFLSYGSAPIKYIREIMLNE